MTAEEDERTAPDGVWSGIDQCVSCGLCLPHCPTWRLTGDERHGPRGRVAAMSAVAEGQMAVDDPGVLASIDGCVGCRSCEPACPSGVPYGELLEATRAAQVKAGRSTLSGSDSVAMTALMNPSMLRAATRAARRAQHVVGRRATPGLPDLPADAGRKRIRRDDPDADVWLFTGCVTEAWQPQVIEDAETVLDAVGVSVAEVGERVPCCGALHAHAGHPEVPDVMDRLIEQQLDDGRPIVTVAAGCGAHLAGRSAGDRVRDVAEVVATRLDVLADVVGPPRIRRLAVHQPCHQRNVMKTTVAVVAVMETVAEEVVVVEEDGLCCGAGGAYSRSQPQWAAQLRDRTAAAIAAAAADVVVSANPGCGWHLADAGVATFHPMTVLAHYVAD